eukprot:TRINITY_DN3603_c0_g1_i1.p6 TRINITY_DN3603_c0_g1~~TRINITY_DN3603_c0_g1_i1.p6  ORF type:complete len:280 (+),score=29.55 TRINITY_DN3603_c0_g1_i1:1073-1912(+)
MNSIKIIKMESEPDIESFLEQIRTTPLSQDMINMILNRLNEADNIASTADAEEEPADVVPIEYNAQEEDAYSPPEAAEPDYEREHFSVSPDSADEQENDIVFNSDFPVNPLDEFEAHAMYPVSDAVGTVNVEDDEEEEQYDPSVEIYRSESKCSKCEEQKKVTEEMRNKYDQLEAEHKKLKAMQRATGLAKNFNAEDLEHLPDSELGELEKKLKGTLEKISAEKEKVQLALSENNRGIRKQGKRKKDYRKNQIQQRNAQYVVRNLCVSYYVHVIICVCV